MLDKLKTVNVEREDLNELVALLAFGNSFISTAEENLCPVEDWVKEAVGTLKREVGNRRRDALIKQLKTARQKQDALKSAEDKRADVAKEIERLEQLLGPAAS